MKSTILRFSGYLSATLLATAHIYAAPVPVTSITTSPSTTPSIPIDDPDGSSFLLTEVSTGSSSFTTLEGSNVSGGNDLNVGQYYYIGDDPGSNAAATSGLLMNAYNAGGSNDNGDYVFNTPDSSATFFLFEVGGNDSFTLTPIDSSDNPIGNYSLTISSTDFGPTLLILHTPHRVGGSDSSSNAPIHGASFTLADFSGTGDLSDFAGFNISTSGGDLCALAMSSAGSSSSSSGNTEFSVKQMYINWGEAPWNVELYDTSFSGTFTTTENGGTTTTFTFDNPVTGVDISDPQNPDFATATASNFGYNASTLGLGVGHPTTGRFTRGQSFTLKSSRPYRMEIIFWQQANSDEQVHFSWIQDGAPQEALVSINGDKMDLLSYNVVPDANTELVITNVSSPEAGLQGRLSFRYFIGRLAFDSPPTYDMSGTKGLPQMFGVNLAGADFKNHAFYQNQTAPEQWAYYESKGQELIRLPFKWERLQNTLGGPLNATVLGHLEEAADLCEQHGMMMILDMHSYAMYSGKRIDAAGSPVTTAHLVDVWYKLADHFKDHPAIYGYGLMNEPRVPDATWANTVQQVINSIRTIDTENWIIVGGTDWSKGQKWQTQNVQLLTVTDPEDKLMYEAHVYFDDNHDGKDQKGYNTEGASPERPLLRAASFVNWLQAHGKRGFVGEYNAPNNDPRWLEDMDDFLAYLMANGVSATYWAGGANWKPDNTNVHPTNNYTVDKVQMSVLVKYGSLALLEEEILIDSEDSTGVTFTGDWTPHNYTSGYEGTGYYHDGNSGKGSKSIRFTPDFQVGGYYEVQVKWTSSSNRASNVPIDITHANGVYPVSVNQKSSGGQWNSMGVFRFDAGTSGNVLISNTDTNGFVIVDAVRFLWQPGPPADIIMDCEDSAGITITGDWNETATVTHGYLGDYYAHDNNDGKGSKSIRFTPEVMHIGEYEVYARWTSGSNRADNVPITINHDGTQSDTLYVNQQNNGGQWVLLGTYSFSANTGDNILISNTGTNGYVMADAIKLVWAD